jgi:hypothetical protein
VLDGFAIWRAMPRSLGLEDGEGRVQARGSYRPLP